MDLLQLMMVAALLVMGMGLALLGSIKVPLARRLNIDEARVGGLISVFGFTLIPVVLSAGFITDQVGRQAVLVTGCLLLVASLVVLAMARSYLAALAGALLLGAGWSALVNVGNVLTPAAFAREGRDMAFATNLANVFFGAGAFLTPLVLAWLFRRTTFASAMLALAAAAAIPGVVTVASIDLDEIAVRGAAADNARQPLQAARPTAPAPRPADGGLPWTNRIVWLIGLAFVCYFPLEASLAGWTTTFLTGHGISEASAARLLSGFWLTYLGARLATALYLPSGRETELVVALAALSLVALQAFVLCRGAGMAIGVILAAGLLFGPIFPTLMALLLSNTDASLHGRAVGMVFALGGIGSSTMPLVIGAVARRAGLQRGFLVAVGLAAALAAITLALLMILE